MKTLDEQIAEAQKRVSRLKARRTKLENERILLVGKAFLRVFDDVPADGSMLRNYMAQVHDAYIGAQNDGHHGGGTAAKMDAGIRLDGIMMDE